MTRCTKAFHISTYVFAAASHTNHYVGPPFIRKHRVISTDDDDDDDDDDDGGDDDDDDDGADDD